MALVLLFVKVILDLADESDRLGLAVRKLCVPFNVLHMVCKDSEVVVHQHLGGHFCLVLNLLLAGHYSQSGKRDVNLARGQTRGLLLPHGRYTIACLGKFLNGLLPLRHEIERLDVLFFPQ